MKAIFSEPKILSKSSSNDKKNFDEFTKRGSGLANYSTNWKAYTEPYRRYQTESFNLIIEVKGLKNKNFLYFGF